MADEGTIPVYTEYQIRTDTGRAQLAAWKAEVLNSVRDISSSTVLTIPVRFDPAQIRAEFAAAMGTAGIGGVGSGTIGGGSAPGLGTLGSLNTIASSGGYPYPTFSSGPGLIGDSIGARAGGFAPGNWGMQTAEEAATAAGAAYTIGTLAEQRMAGLASTRALVNANSYLAAGRGLGSTGYGGPMFRDNATSEEMEDMMYNVGPQAAVMAAGDAAAATPGLLSRIGGMSGGLIGRGLAFHAIYRGIQAIGDASDANDIFNEADRDPNSFTARQRTAADKDIANMTRAADIGTLGVSWLERKLISSLPGGNNTLFNVPDVAFDERRESLENTADEQLRHRNEIQQGDRESQQRVKDYKSEMTQDSLREAGDAYDAERAKFSEMIDDKIAKIKELKNISEGDRATEIQAAQQYGAAALSQMDATHAQEMSINLAFGAGSLAAKQMILGGNVYAGQMEEYSAEDKKALATQTNALAASQTGLAIDQAGLDEYMQNKYPGAGASGMVNRAQRIQMRNDPTLQTLLGEVQNQQADVQYNQDQLGNIQAGDDIKIQDAKRRRQQQLYDIGDQARANQYESSGNSRMAAFTELQNKIVRELTDAGSDPQLQTATKALAHSQLDKLVHGDHEAFMGSSAEYYNKLQAGVLKGGGGDLGDAAKKLGDWINALPKGVAIGIIGGSA